MASIIDRVMQLFDGPFGDAAKAGARALPGVGPMVSAAQAPGAVGNIFGALGGGGGEEAAAGPMPGPGARPSVPGVSVNGDANLMPAPDNDVAKRIFEAMEKAKPGAQQQPMAPPPPSPAAGPAETLPWNQPAPAAPAPSGNAAETIQSVLRGMAAGGAAAAPRDGSSPYGAVFTGMHSSNQAKRQADSDAAESSAAAFNRSLKESEEARAISGESRAVAKEGREAQAQTITNTKVMAEVKKMLGGELTQDQRVNVLGKATDLVKEMMEQNGLTLDEALKKLPEAFSASEALATGKSTDGAPEGATATNKQTGQKMIKQGGRWVPAQ
jgi:hypothetical protein